MLPAVPGGQHGLRRRKGPSTPPAQADLQPNVAAKLA